MVSAVYACVRIVASWTAYDHSLQMNDLAISVIYFSLSAACDEVRMSNLARLAILALASSRLVLMKGLELIVSTELGGSTQTMRIHTKKMSEHASLTSEQITYLLQA